MTTDKDHISYAFIILCMLILFVINVHIVERLTASNERIDTQNKRIEQLNLEVQQLNREVRVLTQDIEILNSIIAKGDYAYD